MKWLINDNDIINDINVCNIINWLLMKWIEIIINDNYYW